MVGLLPVNIGHRAIGHAICLLFDDVVEGSCVRADSVAALDRSSEVKDGCPFAMHCFVVFYAHVSTLSFVVCSAGM